MQGMLFAQISDFHLIEPGRRAFGGIDPTECAERAVRAVNTLDPLPEFVLVTGDIAHDPTPKIYRHARALLDRLRMPYYAIPGNHDGRDPFLEAFGGPACPVDAHGGQGKGERSKAKTVWASSQDFAQYAFERGGYQFIAIDTLDEGAAGGRLCNERLSWLASTLRQTRNTRRVLFLHHPPIDVGHSFMDSIRLEGAEALSKLLREHPAETHILCGHLHRTVSTVWEGAALHMCPGTAHQISLSLQPGAQPMFIHEPPAARLFLETGGNLVSHLVYTDTARPEYPVFPPGRDEPQGDD